MIEVYLGVGALALFAVVYVAFGARRTRRASYDRSDANVAIFSDRRAELEIEGRIQGLGEDERAALDDELAMSLVDEVPDEASRTVLETAAPAPAPQEQTSPAPQEQTSPAPQEQTSAPLITVLAGALVLAGLAVSLYAVWGEPHAPQLEQVAAVLGNDPGNTDPATLGRVEVSLSTRVASRPDDHDSWFYLGHVRLQMADFDGAARAFKNVHELTGTNLELDVVWAQASYLAADATVTDDTRGIIDRIFSVRADHPVMLEMLAMDAIRKDAYPEAAGYLARALGQSLAAERRVLLEEALARARAKLDPGRPLIEVTVTVEDPSPSLWLFVFARSPEGGMPRAVVRRPVKATQTLVLDDTVSMPAAGPLSTSGPVTVVARLSETGAAREAGIQIEALSEAVDALKQPKVSLALVARATPGAGNGVASGAGKVAGKVAVDVSLAPTFEVDPSALVFVIARDPSRPGPPIAVRRLTAGDLPARIELTNADAMIPGRRLSDVETFELLARVSLSGTATASSGDLESSTVTSRVGAEPTTLRIERRLP